MRTFGFHEVSLYLAAAAQSSIVYQPREPEVRDMFL